MLQVRNLVKRYVTKGETVTALDHVSVDFPEKGMVFLLGKSGSGKSTLLNISGGLDAPDEGEVIVNGKSSAQFSKEDFDSYRNTYLGFIFQEYNILSELTVEENIALALELQGRAKDRDRVKEILRQVDLDGFGDRRPNTLSGGQKQRVAIARALVKDPEIIMGDEPTGALDSNTGKQVFDTLKKLSAEKLVIIVSHDREFAEVYADRIIELKDGKIVSDMTRGEEQAVERKNLCEITEKKISVVSGTAVSEEEERKLLAFVRRHKGGVVLSAEDEDLALIPEQRSVNVAFRETDPAETPVPSDHCNFIKSKFPFRYAVKMGFAGLKVKPLRLIFTTLLATVAFIVFGVFSTLLTYTTAKAGTGTLVDSDYQAAVLEKHGVLHIKAGNENRAVEIDSGVGTSHFSEAEIASVRAKNPSMHFVPAYTLETSSIPFYNGSLPISVTSDAYYGHQVLFTAFADASYLPELGYSLTGRLPENAGECAVSSAVFEVFRHYGYGANAASVTEISSYGDLIGKTLWITHNNREAQTDTERRNITLTVTGVVETGEDFSKYEALNLGQAASGMGTTEWRNFESSFASVFQYSMSALCWVGEGFYEQYRPNNGEIYCRRQLSAGVANYLTNNAGAEFDSAFLLKDENGDFAVERQSYNGGGGISWTATLYCVNPESEPAGSYVQYLFAPLAGSRSGKSAVLYTYDHVETANGYYYDAPYDFMPKIRESEKDFTQLTAILGSVAVALAVFAALLLFNFISASINAKKKDIGILRAVGARGIDVFKIFAVEGAVITVLCFALGSILSWAACMIVNPILIAQGVFVFKVFLFDWVNALVIFAVALLSASVSTTVPVVLAVKKRPVEAIRSV